MERITFINDINPKLVLWSVKTTNNKQFEEAKVVLKLKEELSEILDEDEAFLDAYLPKIKQVFLGETFDVEVRDVHILKDGSIYIGFEGENGLLPKLVFDSPVNRNIPHLMNIITIEVFQDESLVTRFTLGYNKDKISLMQYADLTDDVFRHAELIRLDIRPELNSLEDFSTVSHATVTVPVPDTLAVES